MNQTAEHDQGDAVTDKEDSDGDAESTWPCLSLASLKADLVECEEPSGEGRPDNTQDSTTSVEKELRQALVKGLGGAREDFSPDIFFSAQKTLHAIAVDLQEVLAEMETQQFEEASLLASIFHGPLKPPSDDEKVSGDVSEKLEAFDLRSEATLMPKPLELELRPPSAATSMPDYTQRLAELPAIARFTRPLRVCFGDVDRRQDEKDIGRDEVLVNGEPISGARGGYSAVHAAVVAGLRVSRESAVLGEEALDRAAQLLLSLLNRTSSGFAAFEEVLRLFHSPVLVIVSPESAAARPLEAVILGGVALGRAHTRYAVRQADGSDDKPMVLVDATFSFRLTADLVEELTASPEEVTDSPVSWPFKETPATVLLRCTQYSDQSQPQRA